ncbi:dTMP kinase [Nematocida sp. LUAm3]|nr:dTMP kinase [Nematocida sp. LUAm3]KAI5174118.1 dTMP kinase [Nematocida sp. LUAm2]KAI5177139.1 dTMP kinase [Nematocida sp. LUAm1]
MPESLFIVVEGIDRSGKSTLIRSLEESLQKQGIETKTIRYPNRENTTGRLINEALNGKNILPPTAMHLLFSSNRWEDENEIITYLSTSFKEKEEPENKESNLKKKKIRVLLCDRYILSGASYSMANGLSEEYSFSTDIGLPLPHLTILLDTSPKEASTRYGFGREIYENIAFQEKVYLVMKQSIEKYPNIIIPSLSEEETLKIALCEIEKRFFL